MLSHTVVSPAEWTVAREDLLKKEKGIHKTATN